MAVVTLPEREARTGAWTPGRVRPMGYIPGLDGVRAIAVVAVLLYHVGLPWIPGGFLGVDVFFVLSGFLISTLLLQEVERTGTIRFQRFYLRRARRLLPALFLVMALGAVLAVVFARDAAYQFRQDAVSSALYVTNWAFIFQDVSYFEAMGRPPMLQHLWSLAVEEQFYLLWPLALMVIHRRGGRLGVGRVALVGALFSTLLMTVLSLVWHMPTGADASRLYFGTDTHAMGILLGAALATVWRPGALRRNIALSARLVLLGTGLAALGALFWILHTVDEGSAFLYRGGFLVVAGVSAVVIAVVCHPAVGFGRLLATQPMRYLGERSYGLYLYHWPIFVVTRPDIDLPFGGWPATVLRLGLTVAVAELSFRYVEMPIRTGAVARAWDRWRDQGLRVAIGRAAGVLALTAAAVVGTAVAVSAIPAPDARDYLGGVTAVGDGQLTTAGSQTAGGMPAEGGVADETSDPALISAPVTAVGDSVMLGARAALTDGLNVTVDAAVSRQTSDIAARVGERRVAGALGDVVVIHAGTNGTAYWQDLMDVMEQLQDRRRVVLVTVNTPHSWMADSNSNIRSVASKWSNARIADWEAVSAGRDDFFVYDGTHLTEAGARAYTRVIEDAVADLSGQIDLAPVAEQGD